MPYDIKNRFFEHQVNIALDLHGRFYAIRRVHIHAEGEFYDHEAFKPWRLQALAFKAIRKLFPEYPLWRGKDFAYEYTQDVLAIDVINGSPLLREWVDNPNAEPGDLDALTVPDEQAWAEQREPYLIYRD